MSFQFSACSRFLKSNISNTTPVYFNGISFEIFGGNVFHIITGDGVPKGIRTPVTAVKGQCPGPLDDGDTNNPDDRISLAHLLHQTICVDTTQVRIY